MSTANGPDDPAGQVRNLLFEKIVGHYKVPNKPLYEYPRATFYPNNMLKQQLESEKQDLQDQIIQHEKTMSEAQNAIYWLKKRIKLVESQLKAVPEEKTETK